MALNYTPTVEQILNPLISVNIDKVIPVKVIEKANTIRLNLSQQDYDMLIYCSKADIT